MLNIFVQDVETRMAALDGSSIEALQAQCHTLVSTAGQFGFTELELLCADLKTVARDGGGLDRVSDLRAVAARAVVVAQSFLSAKAA